MPSQTPTRGARVSDATHRLQLQHDRGAPQMARRWLVDRFGGDLDEARLATLKLLASELVTNAVVHGTGMVLLEARLSRSRVFVAVADTGCGFLPPPFEPDDNRTHGWGLRIVAEEAGRWGVAERTARVWFELDRGAPDDTRP